MVSSPDLNSTDPRFGVERVLHRLWSAALGHTEFGIHDNFYSVGGTEQSLALLQAAIREEFGFDLSPDALGKAPTISSLTLRLRGGAGTGERRVLIPLKRGKEDLTLVCFPPVGGGVARYAHLARRMDGWAVYGLQSVGLNAGSTPDTTIESMAARYASEVEKIEPSRQLVFLGFSMGGIIAVETAKIVEARQGSVPQVVVVDAPPAYESPEDAGLDFATFVHQVLLLDVDVQDKTPDRWPAELEHVYETAVKRGLLPAKFDKTLLHRIAQVYIANSQAAARYAPTKFEGDVTLFQCTGGDEDEGDFGWAEYARSVRLVQLPSDHFSALEPDQVDAFFEVLNGLYQDELTR
ncbi:alpha/beta fold hydrolase [Streptomyces sp. NPDC051362]|uniref:thioesterase domain-containing protein n=1 Tax=Streptomyces sp. NPDC051362 TaxID=3365651 RepID=UPI0037A6BE1A